MLFQRLVRIPLALLSSRSPLVKPYRVSAVSNLFLSTTSGTEMCEVKVGDKIANVVLTEGLGNFEKQDVDISDLIASKKVVIFGVPGAFTPGCSKSHLPSFIDAQAELKEKGVDLTICIATNDVHVMEVSFNEEDD